MSLQERLESLMHLLEQLAEESDKGLPIIVEGRRDEEALRKLGIRGSVVLSKNFGRSLVDVVDYVQKLGDEAIILVDFDRRGQEWAMSLARNLESAGVTANLQFWREFMHVAGRWVKDVEGIPSFIETLKRKVNRF